MDNFVDFDPMDYSYYNSESESHQSVAMNSSELVKTLVNNNKIVIFSKTSCPHCEDSKLLLKTMGVEYKAVELDEMEEGSVVQNTLGQITDARTVPRIFINGLCVGGNSDLKGLNKRGELASLLKDSSDPGTHE